VRDDWHNALMGRHVVVRPFVGQDVEWLYHVVVVAGVGLTWRFRGALPPIGEFVDHVLKGTEANFVVESLADGAPVAFTQYVDVNYRDQTAALSAVVDPVHQRKGWPIEGLALSVGYGFDVLGFRKIYLTSPESVTSAYRHLVGKLLHEEGRLREHQRVLDRYEDFVVYGMYAREWPEWRARLGYRLPDEETDDVAVSP
jgi:hypothetical protein